MMNMDFIKFWIITRFEIGKMWHIDKSWNFEFHLDLMIESKRMKWRGRRRRRRRRRRKCGSSIQKLNNMTSQNFQTGMFVTSVENLLSWLHRVSSTTGTHSKFCSHSRAFCGLRMDLECGTGKRVAFRGPSSWCSCRSSTARHDSIYRSSCSVCSSASPICVPPHPDPPTWTPLGVLPKQCSSSLPSPRGVLTRTAKVGSDLRLHNNTIMSTHGYLLNSFNTMYASSNFQYTHIYMNRSTLRQRSPLHNRFNAQESYYWTMNQEHILIQFKIQFTSVFQDGGSEGGDSLVELVCLTQNCIVVEKVSTGPYSTIVLPWR